MPQLEFVLETFTLSKHIGIRISWNVWPTRAVAAAWTIIPIAVLYTPLKQRELLPAVQYDPITCKASCNAVLNPYWYQTTGSSTILN